MNSWQTFLASIRLSLPEISSFQRNINFYLKYPDIRSSHARISRSRLVTIDLSQARAPRALPTAQSPFFSLLFLLSRRTRLWGGKKMWVASTGAIHRANIFPCFGNKDRRFEDRNLELFARGIFILYTNII